MREDTPQWGLLHRESRAYPQSICPYVLIEYILHIYIELFYLYVRVCGESDNRYMCVWGPSISLLSGI